MRALICKSYGPAEDLRIEQRPDPEPKPGHAVVDVRAAALNYPDNLLINGLYQVKVPPPFIPGSECAGVISAVADDVRGFALGDEVIALPELGTFAEKCLVPVGRLIPKPKSISFAQAAGLAVTWGTTYHAYKQSAQLQAGETVLVLGAAGGVGITAVELAKAMGATVIAAASTEEKLNFAKSAGADQTINYNTKDLAKEVKRITEGKGVDVVYDPVGGELAPLALRATGWHGRYLVIGFASGTIPQMPANLALLKEASIIGVWWGTWAAKNPQASQQNFLEILALLADGKIELRVTESYAFEDYEKAFAAITERRAMGKVVLEVSG